MKIATLLSCGITLLGSLCCAQEERDPFAEPAEPLPKPLIPERGVLKLPRSVTHKHLDNGHHEYRVVGLYALDEGREPTDAASHCTRAFRYLLPEGAEVEAELKDGSLVIQSSVLIPYDTLAFAIDSLALGGGEMPTWGEMEARDLKRSEHFDPKMYHVRPLQGNFPAGLAWFSLTEPNQLRMPMVTPMKRLGEVSDIKSLGEVWITKTTGSCMCHARFAIRILDNKGQLGWMVEDPGTGTPQFALGDIDGNHIHELYFETVEHGKHARYVLEPMSEQAGAGQPATRPELESKGSDKPQPEEEERSR